MNPKNYLLSQRFRYLGLGAIVGFLLALNERPLSYYMIVGFVLLTLILELWYKRKGG